MEPLPGFEGLVGWSAAMQALFDRIRQVAARHLHHGVVALRAATWIVTARRA